MQNLLSQPYCQFDPDEWTTQTGVPSAADTATDNIPAIEDDCPYKSCPSCPIHTSIQGQSAADSAKRVLEYFSQSPPSNINTPRYYAVSGVEVPCFDLRGQTLYAEQAKEIDLRHFISHGDFNIAKGAIANRLTLANSLFCGSIIAEQVTVDEYLSLNHSHIEGDVSFDYAELGGGLDLRDVRVDGSLSLQDMTIAGDLNLSNATIQGDVDLSETRILGNLKMEDTQVNGDCELPDIKVEGGVYTPGLEVESVWFDHCVVGGHVVVGDVAASEFRFQSSHIKGSFNLFSGDIEDEVVCSQLNVGGETRIGDLDVDGNVSLEASQLSHVTMVFELDISGDFDMSRVDVGHQFRIHQLEIGGDYISKAAELGSYTVVSQVKIRGDFQWKSTNAAGAITVFDLTVRGRALMCNLNVEEYLEYSEVYIGKKLDLSESRVVESVRLEESLFGATIMADEAKVGQQLNLNDSYVSGELLVTSSELGVVRISPDTTVGGVKLRGSHITDQPLDLAGVRIRGEIVLDSAKIERAAKLDDVLAHSLSMNECTINGAFTATNLRVGYPIGSGIVEADQLTVEGDIDFTAARVSNDLSVTRATIGGRVTLTSSWIRGKLRLGNSHFHDEIIATQVNWGAVRLAGATLEDDLLFHRAKLTGGLTAYQLTSNGDTVNIVRSSIPNGVNFQNATFSGDLVISLSSLRTKRPPEPRGSDSSNSVVQATNTEVGGEFLIESDLIHGDVNLSEAVINDQLRIVSSDEDPAVMVGGELDLNETIIEQQLLLKSVSLQDGICASDIRVGSKTKIEGAAGQKFDFTEGFFKWNVVLDNVNVEDLSFRDATLRNNFAVKHTTVSKKPVKLQRAQVHDAELNNVNAAEGIDCTEAQIEELSFAEFENKTIWDDLKISKTRFDGFDFTGFTKSLHKLKHRIHHKRDAGPIHRRFLNFLRRLSGRLNQSISVTGRFRPTRDMTSIGKYHEDHLDREITYRRAKDSADTTGDNTAASEFYRLEKKHRRRRRFWGILGDGDRKIRNTANYISNFLLGASAGHGERISHVGYSAGFFVLLFAILYAIVAQPAGSPLPPVEPSLNQPLMLTIQPAVDYIFLSLGAFVNIPSAIPEGASEPVRFISYIERFIGAAYIPLFVFTLTRSLHR